MNFFEFLILTYPVKRISWLSFKNTLPENWSEELLDFVAYSQRTVLLQLLRYKIPELSLTDVMSLSYPLHRLIDVFIRKRRKYPWKAEVKALIFSWISYFGMQVFVSKVLLDEPEYLFITDPRGWPIFLVVALNGMSRLFPTLPLPAFVNVDELLILPLCAAVAEYCPLFISEGISVGICVINMYLGLLGGLLTRLYVLLM